MYNSFLEARDEGLRRRGASISALFAVVVSVIYPYLMIVYSFVGGSVLQIGSSFAGAAVFFTMFFRRTLMGREKKVGMLLLIIFLVFWGWYGALWTNMRSYGAILVLLSCLGVTWAALEFNLYKYVFEYPFFVFLSITGGLIASGTDQYEFNQMLAVGSRNVYSAILLAFAIGYLFSRRVRGQGTSVILGLALVAASFFLFSRTGLVLAFALFVLFLLGSGVFLRFKVLLIVCVPGLILIPMLFDFAGFIASNSNFEKGLDSPRYSMWASYLSSIDFFNVLFGYDLNSNELIAEHGGNPHSSYFRLHSYFGLGLLGLIFFSVLSFFMMIRRGQWFLVFLMGCFFFRAVFDPVYFIWVFDYIFYPFVFFVFFDDYFSVRRFEVE